METENQRAGHGRSRGKWNRQKRKENAEQNRQNGLNENTQNQDAPNHAAQDSENQGQERNRAGRKIAVAVGGAVLTAAVAAGAVYVGMGQKYKRVYFPNTTINGLVWTDPGRNQNEDYGGDQWLYPDTSGAGRCG